MTPETCGPTSPGWSPPPVRPSSPSRTSPASSEPEEASSASSPTLPPSGSMRSGRWSPRPRQAPPTVGPGSSFSRGAYPPASTPYGSQQNASLYPTPVVTDGADAARHTTTTGVMHPGTTLTDATRQWATPTLEDGERGQTREGMRDGGLALSDQVRGWSPPQPGSEGCSWNTPAARDGKGSYTPGSRAKHGERSQAEGRSPRRGPPDLETEQDGSASSRPDLTLSPRFVEWLMGLPPGWTETPRDD